MAAGNKYLFANKFKNRIKPRRNLGFFFALGISTGVIAAVLELHFLPLLFTTLQQKCQKMIVSCSKTAQAKLSSVIEKLQLLASSWKIARAEKARILCWIMTTLENHQTKAIHVKNTWGKHCHKLLFFSDAPDPDLGAVVLEVDVGREFLWAKTVGAFEYVHQYHHEDYDWVLKADDDTFVLVENAQKRVQSLDWNKPFYLGFQFKIENNDTANFTAYHSGGAGYILSKKSVELFVEVQLQNSGGFIPTHCPNRTDEGPEDLNLGCCLKILGAEIADTRDEKGRQTFAPMDPEWIIFPAASDMTDQWWLFTNPYWPLTKMGRETFSPQYVTSHYVEPIPMYQLYFLIYAMEHVLSVEHIARIKQNTSIWDLPPPSKVNYSGLLQN